MKTVKKYILLLVIFILQSVIYNTDSYAQCAMCKAVVESNMEGNANAVGSGLNTGILYLMAMPYIIAIVAGFYWYRSQKLSARKQIQ